MDETQQGAAPPTAEQIGTMSFEQFESWRNTGKTPEAAAPAAGESTAKTDPDPDPDENAEKKARDESGKFAKKDELPAGVQKRIQREIDKAVQARREAEQLLIEAKAHRGTAPDTKAEPAPKTEAQGRPKAPKSTEFDSWEKYEAARDDHQEALADWKFTQHQARAKAAEAEQQAKAAHAKVLDTFHSQVEAAREKYADFDEALGEVPISQAMQAALLESEHGAELAYHLGKNADEAKRIFALSPLAQVRELGKLEAKLAPAAPQTKTQVSRAPAPPSKVGGKSASASNPLTDPNASYADWEKARTASLKR